MYMTASREAFGHPRIIEPIFAIFSFDIGIALPLALPMPCDCSGSALSTSATPAAVAIRVAILIRFIVNSRLKEEQLFQKWCSSIGAPGPARHV